MLGDLDLQSHLILVITVQGRGCGPHVMDDGSDAEREPMTCPEPHRYQVAELDLNPGLADSQACTAPTPLWLGLLALENLPLASSPAGMASTSTGEQHINTEFIYTIPALSQ